MKYNINAVLREDQLRKVTSIFKRENMTLSLTETMLPKPFQHLTWEEVGAVDPKTDLFLLDKKFLENIGDYQHKRFLSLGTFFCKKAMPLFLTITSP